MVLWLIVTSHLYAFSNQVIVPQGKLLHSCPPASLHSVHSLSDPDGATSTAYCLRATLDFPVPSDGIFTGECSF